MKDLASDYKRLRPSLRQVSKFTDGSDGTESSCQKVKLIEGKVFGQDDTIIKLPNTTEYLRFIYKGPRQEFGGDSEVITMLHVR